MSTRYYALPVEQTKWEVPSGSTTIFQWEYDESRDRLLNLYEKGKDKQWNAQTRIDWSIPLDPGSPDNAPDEQIAIYGSDMWAESTSETCFTACRLDQESETLDLEETNHIGMNIESFARAALGQGEYHIDDAAILHTVAALEAVLRSAEADGAWKAVE